MSEPEPLGKVDFHYLKNHGYRTIHVDGAYGGVSSSGKVFLVPFTERPPIPQSETQTFFEDGTRRSQKKEGKEGLIRELDAGLLMDVDTAKAIAKLLGEFIATAEQLQARVKREIVEEQV